MRKEERGAESPEKGKQSSRGISASESDQVETQLKVQGGRERGEGYGHQKVTI